MDAMMLYQLIYLVIIVALFLIALRVGFTLLLFAIVGFLAGFVYNALLVPLLRTPQLPVHNFWVLVLAGAVVWLFVRK